MSRYAAAVGWLLAAAAFGLLVYTLTHNDELSIHDIIAVTIALLFATICLALAPPPRR